MSTANEHTILVTGATGNVGRPLVEQLLADGHRVRALTRDPSRAALPDGAEVVAGNLLDSNGLRDLLDGVTGVHLISFADDVVELPNADGIVTAAVRAGVRRATVLHGGLPRNPLHDALTAHALPWASLIPGAFMSNALWNADSVRQGVHSEGFADQPAAMIHPADIAAVAATILTEEDDRHVAPDGREHLLTGPEPLTPPEQISIIAEVIGQDVRFVELSRDEQVAAWRAAGFGEEEVEFFLAMSTDPPIGGAALPTVAEITGVPPRTFRQWVRENAAAFRS